MQRACREYLEVEQSLVGESRFILSPNANSRSPRKSVASPNFTTYQTSPMVGVPADVNPWKGLEEEMEHSPGPGVGEESLIGVSTFRPRDGIVARGSIEGVPEIASYRQETASPLENSMDDMMMSASEEPLEKKGRAMDDILKRFVEMGEKPLASGAAKSLAVPPHPNADHATTGNPLVQSLQSQSAFVSTDAKDNVKSGVPPSPFGGHDAAVHNF